MVAGHAEGQLRALCTGRSGQNSGVYVRDSNDRFWWIYFGWVLCPISITDPTSGKKVTVQATAAASASGKNSIFKAWGHWKIFEPESRLQALYLRVA